MPDFTHLQEELILEANEDVAWLPDAMNIFHEANPGVGLADSIAAVAADIRKLVEEGYVEMCQEMWMTPPRDRLLVALPDEEIELALSNEGNWDWDNNKDDYFVLNTTETGKEAFLQLIQRPSK